MDKYGVEKRRAEVWRLKRMGWTYEKISEYLNTPVGTIMNDMEMIKRQEKRLTESNQKLIEDTVKAVLEVLSKYQLLESESWKCYMDITSPADKIKALVALGKIYQDIAKLLKILDFNKGNVNIEKYINIENLVPMLNQVIMVIDKYIPEDKKVEAFKELKTLDILKSPEKK